MPRRREARALVGEHKGKVGNIKCFNTLHDGVYIQFEDYRHKARPWRSVSPQWFYYGPGEWERITPTRTNSRGTSS